MACSYARSRAERSSLPALLAVALVTGLAVTPARATAPAAAPSRLFDGLRERLAEEAAAGRESSLLAEESAPPPGIAVIETAPPPELASPPLASFPRELGKNLLRMFSTHELPAIAIGAGAAGSAYMADDPVAAYLGRRRRLRLFGDGGDILGSAYMTGSVTALVMSIAYRGDNHHLRRFSFSMGQGLALTQGLVQGVKVAVGRRRPNGESANSFPSGHAATAFTCASVIGQHYGRKAAFFSYAIAGLIGVSRMEKDKHFFSDIVAGAFLGEIVARTVVRGSRQSSPVISISPIAVDGGRGIALHLRF